MRKYVKEDENCDDKFNGKFDFLASLIRELSDHWWKISYAKEFDFSGIFWDFSQLSTKK